MISVTCSRMTGISDSGQSIAAQSITSAQTYRCTMSLGCPRCECYCHRTRKKCIYHLEITLANIRERIFFFVLIQRSYTQSMKISSLLCFYSLTTRRKPTVWIDRGIAGYLLVRTNIKETGTFVLRSRRESLPTWMVLRIAIQMKICCFSVLNRKLTVTLLTSAV